MGVGSDAQTLTSVVMQLREIHRLSGWVRTCAIGELVLNELFGGSVENWRTGVRDRTQSLRRLAAHPDCPLKKSALAEAVAVHVFVQENPGIRELTNITPGHVALVHGRERAQAIALLQDAETRRLGVKALARSLLVSRSAPVEVRRTASAALKELREIERRLKSVVECLEMTDVRINLDEEQADRLLSSIRQQLTEAERPIARFRRSLESGGSASAKMKGLPQVHRADAIWQNLGSGGLVVNHHDVGLSCD